MATLSRGVGKEWVGTGNGGALLASPANGAGDQCIDGYVVGAVVPSLPCSATEFGSLAMAAATLGRASGTEPKGSDAVWLTRVQSMLPSGSGTAPEGWQGKVTLAAALWQARGDGSEAAE